MIIGLAIGWAFGGTTAVAAIGEQAPDFTVEVFDGGSFTLSEAGKPVVLNFWASWCVPCRTEIPDISAFAAANPEIQVVGVAVEDTERSARGFAAEVVASYPLALGTDEIEEAYPRIGLPATYIIDADGVVTDIYNGIVTEDLLSELLG
ncbi:MAG TPA: TlpA disulfide reductase family protein [Acidimicrobiia bacterium]|nr:TlpA disulfide reductase family protein [Acidimicrobiia bacterium]